MKRFVLVSVVLSLICGSYFIFFTEKEKLKTDSNVAKVDGDYWEGTWFSEKTKVRGTFAIALTIVDNELIGDIKIKGSSVTKGGSIRGTVDDNNKIEFGLIKGKKGKLRYYGTIYDDSTSGTWQIPVIKDYGVWEAKKKT